MLRSETQGQSESESLLEYARRKSRFLSAITSEDIGELASHISVLEFEEGQQIIQEGEQASWIGIVCAGTLEAVVNGTVVGSMQPGHIVGEVSYFSESDDGRRRAADVRGSSNGYIAFMQASDLLELLKTSPRCGCTLMRALGASALYQLSHNTAHHKQIA